MSKKIKRKTGKNKYNSRGPMQGGSVLDLLHSALSLHQSGRLNEAEQLYEQVLIASPDHPDANHLYGVLQQHLDRFDDAVKYIGKAVKLKPNEPIFLNNFGEACRQAGLFEKAVKIFLKANRLKRDFPEVYNNLGNTYKALGNLDDAIKAYEHALLLMPDFPESLINLGVIYREMNILDKAEKYLQGGLRLAPNDFQACIALGLVYQAQEKFADAEEIYRKAISIDPGSADAFNNLGNIYLGQGRLDEAGDAFDKALQFRSDYFEAYNNIGFVFLEAGRIDEAISAYQKALEFEPDCVAAHVGYAKALREQGKPAEAENEISKVIRAHPDDIGSLLTLSMLLCEQGRVEEAFKYYEKSAVAFEEDPDEYSSYLFRLNYLSNISSSDVFIAHQHWAKIHAENLSNEENNVRNKRRYANRKLKIGYLSPDFKKHSVSYFFEPVLLHHNRDKFEIYCYSNVKVKDSITDRFKELSDHWRDIVQLTNLDAARLIENDKIDILIDLAGHTSNNRLKVFAYKPAPIQVNWLGYPNTTGMKVMDYRIVDEITDPHGDADSYCSEKLIRMPHGFLCYMGDKTLKVEDAPFQKNKFITFGSFNNLPKITTEVIDLWSKVLIKVPDSRLILKCAQFADQLVQKRFLDEFANHGINSDRIDLLGRISSQAEHMQMYGRIDIGLDPIVYNGTTTTFEALWMGVPVISFLGERHASRVGASILSHLGLKDLIVSDVDQYVEVAAELAMDQERLGKLRKNLRQRMMDSPLCDAAGFVMSLEEIFLQLVNK